MLTNISFVPYDVVKSRKILWLLCGGVELLPVNGHLGSNELIVKPT